MGGEPTSDCPFDGPIHDHERDVFKTKSLTKLTEGGT